ncbi:hypothetical protein G6F57_000839 [Rhizopus arrhizus]|uniref:Uncharacterized protein n=1 Tax=Rhizopus oryzae TaxID=64495 RepID=A0A9P6XIE1_RHIOR|nr:hypothetical protein G6F23_002654 [Rhizopus arrhizus]KAG0765132.1 hypothetical protein G6F24_004666 [Rhizopus arrhizus]KAG0796595.1 hypothetical protein G6F21_001190 [Rhizopus arrhizus]KAG0800999.1 hypothetical protein G6F22_001677 [Rhizopus arrhizus]KAG0820029.1 hypothetical protein G6F20_000269 [Rhizopus arrhizus]
MRKLDAINRDYKHSEKLETAATEIYEELSSLIDEENSIFANILEKTRRLAVFAYANATKALRLPPSVRHFAEEEETDKNLAFAPEIVEQVHKARFEQSLLREVDLDNCQTNNIFLGEATQTRNSTTTSNDCNHHHRNNNEVPKHLPHLETATTRYQRMGYYQGTAPILQPILEVHDPPLLAIGGNTRRISNTMELNSTKMEI